ncbi:glycosyltransferase family 4 protein [Natrinema caseinilyticum]|uniref:glycosyltransferase family 4 protein n=1 Tax=Natrinema caseinilyticum TaxID=2961570 RepID=UPI0020C4B2CB|nr:glycosyltransferase family 4 protein [Natrinema caseinilyticum]
MRVLTLNYEFPPLGGGAAPVSEELAATLVDRGHDVDVVTMGYGDLPSRENRRGIRIHRVPSLRGSRSMSRPHEMASYIPTGFLRARRLLSRRSYDVVHTHFIVPTGVIALSLNARYGVPYVITAHGSDVPGYNPDRFDVLHRATGPIWRRIAAGADCVVSPSNYLSELIRSADSDTSDEVEVEVVPNGFDHETYDANRETTDRILLTSRLFERKGIQHFLDALAAVDTDWEVVITGEGPYLPALERRADRLDQSVSFPGWVDRETLTELLETSEIYVFPSSHENCPVALQEAMAAGTAIVASKYSGTAEVIGDAGLTVDPEDTASFSAALSRLLSDPALRSRLQAQSRARLEKRYGWDRIGTRYQNVLGAAGGTRDAASEERNRPPNTGGPEA